MKVEIEEDVGGGVVVVEVVEMMDEVVRVVEVVEVDEGVEEDEEDEDVDEKVDDELVVEDWAGEGGREDVDVARLSEEVVEDASTLDMAEKTETAKGLSGKLGA